MLRGIVDRAGDSLLRNPISGIVACSPKATSGQTKAPPIRLTKLRRIIRSPCTQALQECLGMTRRLSRHARYKSLFELYPDLISLYMPLNWRIISFSGDLAQCYSAYSRENRGLSPIVL